MKEAVLFSGRACGILRKGDLCNARVSGVKKESCCMKKEYDGGVKKRYDVKEGPIV